MQNLQSDLIDLLKKDERFIAEDKLLKNSVIEAALKLDPVLLKLLRSNKSLKKHFFRDIEGILVFDKIEFQKFVSNKSFLKDSYTAFTNKIGLTSDDEFISENKEVVLSWPHKDCVLEGGQTKEDEKRDEIFWNETLAPDEIDRLLSPKVLTNFKRYDGKGKHKVTDVSLEDNLIIKGNNLLALHSLLPVYRGRIKLIYIDPPYNTGKDSFRYNDNFNHSSWLTFMKNRLVIAKELLANDGVLMVQSDDKEQAYLKVLLDEVMYKEQFETSFYIQVRFGNKTLSEDDDFQKVIEVVHVYSKSHLTFLPNKLQMEYSIDKFKYEISEEKSGKVEIINGKKVEIFKEGSYNIKEVEPNYDALKETWATGGLIRQGGTAAEFLSKYLIKRKKIDGLKTLYKIYDMGMDGLGYRYITGPRKKEAFRGKFYSGIPLQIKDDVIAGKHYKEKPIPNFVYNYLQYEGDFGNCRSEGGVDIGGGKKPELLLKFFIEHFTNKGDIVLDYHLGSGTTSAVAHKMGRQYIGIEQLDYGKNDSIVRLKNVIKGDKTGISKEEDVNWKGGGSFVFCELKELNQKILNQIKSAKTIKVLKQIWETIKKHGFISYKVNPKDIDNRISEFGELSIADQKKFLIEVLDKNHLYVNYSEIDDKDYNITVDDKKLNKKFYSLK